MLCVYVLGLRRDGIGYWPAIISFKMKAFNQKRIEFTNGNRKFGTSIRPSNFISFFSSSLFVVCESSKGSCVRVRKLYFDILIILQTFRWNMIVTLSIETIQEYSRWHLSIAFVYFGAQMYISALSLAPLAISLSLSICPVGCHLALAHPTFLSAWPSHDAHSDLILIFCHFFFQFAHLLFYHYSIYFYLFCLKVFDITRSVAAIPYVVYSPYLLCVL